MADLSFFSSSTSSPLLPKVTPALASTETGTPLLAVRSTCDICVLTCFSAVSYFRSPSCRLCILAFSSLYAVTKLATLLAIWLLSLATTRLVSPLAFSSTVTPSMALLKVLLALLTSLPATVASASCAAMVCCMPLLALGEYVSRLLMAASPVTLMRMLLSAPLWPFMVRV